MLLRVILAIREPALRKRIGRLLPKDDALIETVDTRKLLWERTVRKSCDLVVASRSIIPEPDPEKIRLLHELPESPLMIILSETDTPEERARFIAAGYDAVANTNLSDPELRSAFASILKKRREHAMKLLASGTIPMAQPRLDDFVSHSPAMQAFMQTASRVVNSDSTLLILGETGVGKERLARAIHAEGPRSSGPFIAVNCGAFPEALLESELFGHEEGAFTGATRSHRGCFELAHHGVIFLDEIGDMPIQLQVKLLHVLQEHEVRRIGSEKPFKADVRVFAATNRDLREEVKARRFRQDLYYRLNVVTLTIPPLRDRPEDIPDLIQSYLTYLRPRVGRKVVRVSDDARKALCKHCWPGNVRELINIIERAMLLCDEDEITLRDLPTPIGIAGSPQDALPGRERDMEQIPLPEGWLKRPLDEVRQQVLEHLERTYLAAVLRQTGGHVGQAAKAAGFTPRSLFDKMRRYGLAKEDFRKVLSERE
jgi:two-component system, NtrC family, response regulator AtoC